VFASLGGQSQRRASMSGFLSRWIHDAIALRMEDPVKIRADWVAHMHKTEAKCVEMCVSPSLFCTAKTNLTKESSMPPVNHVSLTSLLLSSSPPCPSSPVARARAQKEELGPTHEDGGVLEETPVQRHRESPLELNSCPSFIFDMATAFCWSTRPPFRVKGPGLRVHRMLDVTRVGVSTTPSWLSGLSGTRQNTLTAPPPDAASPSPPSHLSSQDRPDE